MCGICGIWAAGESDRVRTMISAMHHRGPDDQGVYADERVALGMARLAILDVTAAGHQPMSNPDGSVWIVYNGETYNFAEQRALLERRGHTFSSNSDTEVVLQLYQLYGDDFLLRLRGMFALAIYDKRRGRGRERLLLARDPLGIKPLLYTGDPHRFAFASEIKALLAGGLIKPDIDPGALHGLLAHGSIAQPSTILKGARMLPPGHRLTIESGHMTVERYWTLDTSRVADVRNLSYADQARRLRQILEESVRSHMVSDVPVGAFLSGGVDSTVLVGLMARMSSRKVRTFSVGFGDEGAAIDETDAAARTSALIGTDHVRVSVTGRDVRDRILDIASALDQPSVDGVNAYFVSAAAGGNVKVAISGTGGDELFAGYPWFASMARATPGLRGRGPWALARRLASKLAATGPLADISQDVLARALARVRASGDFLELFARQYQIFGAHNARRLLAPGLSEGLGRTPSTRSRAAAADELPEASTLARVSALCLRGYTQNQLLRDIDAVSMAHSLEVRVPFLDPVVVDFALSLPDEAKLTPRLPAGGKTAYRDTGAKRILLDATRDILPPDIADQPKRGFSMPFESWLRGPLREVVDDTLSARSVGARGLFDPAAVEIFRRAFFQGKSSWALPWLLMMTELWCRQVIDAPPRRATSA